MSLFQAKELFRVRIVESDWKMPCWANLRISRTKGDAVTSAKLTGAGLYAIFFEGSLTYIGLYAGLNAAPFGGSVLDRWSKHIVGQTLRARDLFFRPKPLQSILQLNGEPADGLAHTLPNGRQTTIGKPDSALYPPLKTRAIKSSFNQAVFATAHWNLLKPGAEEAFLGRFTFEYQQIRRPKSLQPDKSVVKFRWLKPRENELIAKLRPICNQATDPANARRNVKHEEARDEMARVLAAPLEPFGSTHDLPTSPAVSFSAPCSNGGPETTEEEDAVMSAGEVLFRKNLFAEGETFIAELLEKCPDAFSPFFTNKVPQLRVCLNTGRQRRVLVMVPSKTGFQCSTLASVEACRRAKFDAEPPTPSEGVMKARFWFDPSENTLDDLFKVVQAAGESLKTSNRVTSAHSVLLQASKPEGSLPVISTDDIESIIGKDCKGAHLDDIMSVVRRLAEALASGGYNQILDVIEKASTTNDEPTYWPDLIFPSRTPVNVIPGALSGRCCPMLVAFSAQRKGLSPQGRKRSVEPLRATLPKVREHLIRCFGVTEVVILVTDECNPAVFKESSRDIIAHRDRRTTFLPLLANGNRLTPIALPF